MENDTWEGGEAMKLIAGYVGKNKDFQIIEIKEDEIKKDLSAATEKVN